MYQEAKTTENVITVNAIPYHSFTEDNKTIIRSVISKKLSNYKNIFYYMKNIVLVLQDKVSDLKRSSFISADEYDLMFVMVKKINEAVIDAYNEYMRIQREEEKVNKP